METQLKHHSFDITLQFYSPSNYKISVKATDLALIIQENKVVECRLTFTVSPQVYQQIDEKGIFHLYQEVRTEMTDEGFAADIPIEIEAKLEESLLANLLINGSTIEEITAYLLELSRVDQSNILLFTDSWYGLYVKQSVPLPMGLVGTGELKMGYRTSWVDEQNSEKVTVAVRESMKAEDEVTSIGSDKPILQVITNFFTKDRHRVYRWEEETVISLPYKGENGEWRCYAEAKEEESLCCFYSVCPVTAPQEKRLAIAELITRINYTLAIGNFEMDFTDGEIRFRTSIDVEGDCLSTSLFRQLTIANVTMMDRYLKAIMAVIYDDVLPEYVSASS